MPRHQYIKQEEIRSTENGREARAIRLITERASGRIGRMAFELARARPRKVRLFLPFSFAQLFLIGHND